MLVPDPELGILRPAPGFSQTLPGGSAWRVLLERCAEPGEYRGEVAFPDRHTMRSARAYVAEDGLVLVLVGGTPSLSQAQFKDLPIALLAGLIRAETTEQAALGVVASARDATRRAFDLAGALDRARAETEGKAAELQRSLAEAASLNRQLRQLNDTLEDRVRERTRDLERQTEERLKAESALLQAQKMEAVGQLTGGVAHDFNNLLSVIVGSLDLLEGMAGDNQRLLRTVKMAQRAASRGARLTEQLLTFSRRQMLRPQTIKLNDVIAEYQGLLQRAVGEAIQIKTELTPIPCFCSIDPVHLETAILNLAINARDAMPSGGTLTIQTATCTIGSDEEDDLVPGPYLQITIRDTGLGMTTETRERVFEPFFTTKAEGKGTGLGLSQVYGFVKQSGGRILVESAVGTGTAVQIYLPLVSGEEVGVEEVDTKRANVKIPSATILAVEDDTDVADIVLSVLNEAGFDTHVARSGNDALAFLDAGSSVDLLFTDLVMPGGMNGIELARAARGRRPGLKVLLTSGYAAAAGVTDDASRHGFPLILKPYRQHELIEVIRTLLDGMASEATVGKTA